MANTTICKTYNTHTKKPNVSCQTVTNDLHLENISEQLDCMDSLKVGLIAKRLIFKKSL